MSEQVIGFDFRIQSPKGEEIGGVELILTRDGLTYRDQNGVEYDHPKLLGGKFLVQPSVAAQIFAKYRKAN